jgi:hypothetical protein
MARNKRDVIEPRPGDERLVERDERGRFTEQEQIDSPRRGSSRDMGRDLERGTVERDDLGRSDLDATDLEDEGLDRS